MIIIEGMDNSGKSTLALHIARRLGLQVQESEGPPRSAQEINDRCRRYATLENTLLVRHPVVSNAIYGHFRPEGDPITADIREQFYDARHLIIYCDPVDRPLDDGHVVKDHDTPEHLALIRAQKVEIAALYRGWAIRHAHIVYRIGDDMDRIVDWAHGH